MSALAASVLLGGLRGTEVPEWLRSYVAGGLAGVVLFAENTPDVAATRNLCDELHALRGGCVVAIDEEGGDVSRLEAATGSSLPGLAALGEVDDVALTRRAAAALGRLQALAGVDLDLAPVLDVASEPLNPVIGARSFGGDPDLVARQGEAFVDGLHGAGIAACSKHFPGHGDTVVDSHLELPVVEADAATVLNRDVAPFLRAASDAAMTAHLLVPALGDGPASLSPWATQLLRDAGFDGPIITDALGMGAVAQRHTLGDACVLALSAGADLLCLDAPQHRDPEAALEEAVAAIDAALLDGRLDPEALAASADRVRRLRFRGARPELTETALAAARRELEDVGADVAGRAVRAVGDVRVPSAPLLLDLRRGQHFAAGSTSTAFAQAVRGAWPDAEIVVPEGVADVTRSLRAGRPVVALTRRPGSDVAEAELLRAVLQRAPESVVIHAGTAASAPVAHRLVLAHGVGRANARAACALLDGGAA